MPIDAARGLQLRSDSVTARLYQERLYSSGPAGAIMREIWLLVAQVPAESGARVNRRRPAQRRRRCTRLRALPAHPIACRSATFAAPRSMRWRSMSWNAASQFAFLNVLRDC